MRLTSLALLCASYCVAPMLGAAVSDPNWSETTVSTDGSQHTGMAWAPDGSDRLFVLEKTGRVRVMSGLLTAGTPSWSTFATMPQVFTNSECGLIGMAFDPDYVSNRYVYFFVTVSASEQRIYRYRDAGGSGVTPTVIMSQLPTNGNNHDGGGIGFGADGKLYWSIGDLGNGTGVDNNLTSLASKVGRANRDGSLPPDNPFADGAGSNNDYIYARGMRNPFTMQFQASTGLMWLNVVGTSYEQIFVVTAGDHGGYNDFENNQPAPTASDQYITPRIVYRTNGSDTRNFTGTVARSGGVATFTTTAAAHGLRVGGNITISGVADASFNGSNQYVASVPSPNTFTVLQAGPDATSSGGQAVTLNQGGCLTGGVFYDASAADPVYRGNFFYGDCNSGRINRARIDPGTNQVQSVDYWGTGNGSQVDVDVGPDGALYYISSSSNAVRRARFNAAGQALVVSRLNLRLDEGGQGAFAVSLAQEPAAEVAVSVARTGGDADVGVLAGSNIVFTPANWNRPQVVRLAVAPDLDSAADVATISVQAIGLATVPVTGHVLDLYESDELADLAVTVTDNISSVAPGGSTTYVLTVANAGPDAAPRVQVLDRFPEGLSCAWTCSGTGGGTCSPSGSDDIDDIAGLPGGGTVTYAATCTIDVALSGVLVNTAVAVPLGAVGELDSADNSDTDTTSVDGADIFADGFEG